MHNNEIIDINDNINVKHFTEVDNLVIGNRYKNNLNILYLNIQRLRNKLHDLELLIASYKCPIHCIVLTEIWLNKSENIFYNIPGYTSYFSNREKSYGGVAIFISEQISSTQVVEEEFEKSHFLVVRLLKEGLNIISVYRSHGTNVEAFVSKLDEYTSKYNKSLILGDFNINLLNKNSSDVRNYSNTLLSNGFIIYNKISPEYSTRITSTSKTIIDHFVTDLIKNEYLFHILNSPLSDHQSFLLSVNKKITVDKLANHKTVLNYENVEKNIVWTKLNSFSNFNSIVNCFCKLITDNTKTIPHKKQKKKHDWITNEILTKMKIRDSYFKYKKKYCNDAHVERLYNQSKYEVQRLVFQAKIKYCTDEITKNNGNSRKLWNLYKQIMYNKNDFAQKSRINLIKHRNENFTTDRDIAECFNNFFVNVTDELNCPNEPIDFQYLNRFTRSPNFCLDLAPTNIEEVKLVINNLKSGAATGYDNISSKFIKRYSNMLSPVLVKFINTSFETFTFPDSLKTAVVTPIFKNGNTTTISNYRPISVLTSFSKVFESIIKQRLNSFMVQNEILHKEQYGFEKNSNTAAACLSLTHFISHKIDEGNYVACVFLDFQKAFDCVDHEILLYKLEKLNLNQNQVSFFRSYLCKRQQRVRINNTLSEHKTNKKGVPQGSILGPDLFKIYINDISFLNLKGQIQLYADDAALKYSSKHEEDIRNDINHDFVVIEEWLKKHRILLNTKKTKIILFENRNFANINFYFNNEKIETVKNFNYLGLILDSKLKWVDHIDHIIKKTSPYVFILKRLRKFLSRNTLYVFYSSYILSNIVYLNPIWSRASQMSLNKLDILHKKAIKTINFLPIRHPTNLLYNERYISFHEICKYELFMTAFKIINNYIKHTFILNRMIDIHRHNTRNRSNFYLSLFKTSNQKNNCLYNCLKLYNELPEHLKYVVNIREFKKEIRKYIRTREQS